jgi:hypothetical protein
MQYCFHCNQLIIGRVMLRLQEIFHEIIGIYLLSLQVLYQNTGQVFFPLQLAYFNLDLIDSIDQKS